MSVVVVAGLMSNMMDRLCWAHELEVRLHPEVEAWFLGLCQNDPITADGLSDAIDQLVEQAPASEGPWSIGSRAASFTT